VSTSVIQTHNVPFLRKEGKMGFQFKFFLITSTNIFFGPESKVLYVVLQSEKKNQTRTSSAHCGGGTGDLALHLPPLDHHSGLQEQDTSR